MEVVGDAKREEAADADGWPAMDEDAAVEGAVKGREKGQKGSGGRLTDRKVGAVKGREKGQKGSGGRLTDRKVGAVKGRETTKTRP
jgi:hypothetical protein